MNSRANALPTPAAAPMTAGSVTYRRANLALFAAGFACFAMLYGTQPILTVFVDAFGVSPASASLTVSAATFALALGLIPASVLSDRFGRHRLMRWSLAAAALCALLVAFAGTFGELLVCRALLGFAIAGVPAAALAYLGEEVAPEAQGQAVGLYIAGNALGGMSGRFLSALLTDWSNWRIALAVLGGLGLAAALAFWRLLPPATQFRPRQTAFSSLHHDARQLFADPGLPWLFLTAFLLMGGFVGMYNFLGFRLVAEPYHLGTSAIGAIFLLYVVGSWASAWTGRLSDRLGRRNVLWVMVAIMLLGLLATLAGALPFVILGVALFTFGFFGAHTAASGWVGRRAGERRALASAIYLTAYYLGSSIPGTLVGLAWDGHAWPGVVTAVGLFTTVVLAAALLLRRVPPVRP